MKILIASDKYKGSATAQEVCQTIATALIGKNETYQVIQQPLADGGDGSLDVLKDILGLEEIELMVLDPLFRPVTAKYLIKDNRAFIELAQASGLTLVDSKQRNPMFASTFGTGQMIKDAIKKGANEIFLFVGGSATNEAGIGMAHALGYRFLDAKGKELEPIGKELPNIKQILKPTDNILENIVFTTVCDVENPLTGTEGATHVFSKQKGANIKQTRILEQGMIDLRKLIENKFDIDIDQKGSGAAGGFAGGSLFFLNAKLEKGIDMFERITNLEEKVKDIDIIITGEGRFDSQSLHGKVVSGIFKLAKKYTKPVYVVCGSSEISIDQLENENLKGVYSILDISETVEEAMEECLPKLTQVVNAISF